MYLLDHIPLYTSRKHLLKLSVSGQFTRGDLKNSIFISNPHMNTFKLNVLENTLVEIPEIQIPALTSWIHLLKL